MRTIAALLVVIAVSAADDWSNSGGNAWRNGLSMELGPLDANLLWSGGRNSIISWLPVSEGNRLFLVRQNAWPGTPGDSPVVCMNLMTGGELWTADLPFETGDWITWVGGVSEGLVYASRGGNGASVSAPLYALDAEDGGIAWVSAFEIDAGSYDGMVFAEDGDPIIASFQDIWRVDSEDGSLEWHASRTGSVSGQCGGCLSGDAFYVVDAAPGGHRVVRYDAVTGAEMYEGSLMPGFTAQCTPMAGADGAVYFNRSQDNSGVDFFYAFRDSAGALTESWHIPTVNACAPEFGIGPDGSLYFVVPGPRLARVSPSDGSIINQTDVLQDYDAARISIGADGAVYFSNGCFGQGRLCAFTADLSPLWDVPVPNINIGGPALCQGGVLVVCGTGTDVRAYAPSSGIPEGAARTPSSLSVLPNPSSGAVTVTIPSWSGGTAEVTVLDLSGRLIRVLPTDPSGGGEIQWDGRDSSGRTVPAGAYLVRVVSGALNAETMLVRL
jgi:hypothetical protein